MFDLSSLIGEASGLLGETHVGDIVREAGVQGLLERSGYDFSRLEELTGANVADWVADDGGQSVSDAVHQKVDR